MINHNIPGDCKTFEMVLLTIFSVPCMMIDRAAHRVSNLLSYGSALLDIVDGAEMTETELDPKYPTNLVWVEITICLAVLMAN